MDPYMKVGFCMNCGKAVKLYDPRGKIQKDWDAQATEKCGCMQIKKSGRTVTVNSFRQMDFSDLGI